MNNKLNKSHRPIIIGNWKMNGLLETLNEVHLLDDTLKSSQTHADVNVIVCPPTTLLMKMSDELEGKTIGLGAQDCHFLKSGAHTGDISAEMLADAGASAIIVGHSERRCDHAETDEVVLAKQQAVHRAGLIAITCIGETAGQRRAGLTFEVVKRQLQKSLSPQSTSLNTIIAYEPIWAIGTGIIPSFEQVEEVHTLIRSILADRYQNDGASFRIVYGGSVKPENAKGLLGINNVNGALVGGASLKASDLLTIISSCPR